MNTVLQSNFCGIPSKNPFFLASSCVAGNYDMCARAFDMGWAGAVFKSLSKHTAKEASPRFAASGGNSRHFAGFRNIETVSDRPLIDNLKDIEKLKKNYPENIVIISIMADHNDDWVSLAKAGQDYGSDALEFNISCPHMDKQNMGIASARNIEHVEELCAAVTSAVNIPTLAKISPSTAPVSLVTETVLGVGVNGITVTNTFPSISGYDLKRKGFSPLIDGKSAKGGYSGRAIHPLALAQIADIAKLCKGAYISGAGGIYTWKDALEAILLGASTVQICTAVMEYGYRIIDDLNTGLSWYLSENGLVLSDIIGIELENIVSPEELQRENFHLVNIQHDTCIGCGRCYISCRDGGHQAISWAKQERKPQILAEKCVGCHLCKLVCPTMSIVSDADAI